MTTHEGASVIPAPPRRHYRSGNLWTRYRLTLADYQAISDAQGAACAICRTPPAEGEWLHVDHDHACCAAKRSCGKCIRGLLCESCNRALGFMADDSERLRVAAQYLDAYRQKGAT